MTSVGYNFNDFSKNQLTKFPAVWTVLRQNIVHNQGLGIKPPSPSGNFACDFRCRISDHELNRKPEVVFKIVCKSQEMVQKRLFEFLEILQHPRNRSIGDMLRTVIVDKPEMQRPQRTDSDHPKSVKSQNIFTCIFNFTGVMSSIYIGKTLFGAACFVVRRHRRTRTRRRIGDVAFTVA